MVYIPTHRLAFGRRRFFISFIRPRTSFKIRRSTRASSNTAFIQIFHPLSCSGLGRLLFLYRSEATVSHLLTTTKILSACQTGFTRFLHKQKWGTRQLLSSGERLFRLQLGLGSASSRHIDSKFIKGVQQVPEKLGDLRYYFSCTHADVCTSCPPIQLRENRSSPSSIQVWNTRHTVPDSVSGKHIASPEMK